QQIIAYESGVTDTVDPLGGAWAIEALTSEIEERARDYIQRIDEMGGMLKAIEDGFIQREIQESAYRYQREVEEGDRHIVGVNCFRTDEAEAIDTLRVDPEVEKEQRRSLSEVRARRDGTRVEGALSALERAARGKENLLPFILEAVRAYATVGEISDALRAVFGVHREFVVV
ncbi:MAG: methylmalonyl-CoA mutase family protein, partial [Nitrospinota bacterium]